MILITNMKNIDTKYYISNLDRDFRTEGKVVWCFLAINLSLMNWSEFMKKEKSR